MKRICIFFLAAIVLSACTTQKQLYTWDSYTLTSYNYLKDSDEKSINELIQTYEKIIKEQKGTRAVVPPGIYADYGFLLLQIGKVEVGKTMLLKEIELYPESKVFIERILKMTEK